MRAAVYNSAIPNMLHHRSRIAPGLRVITQFLIVMFGLASGARAVDWSAAEQQLARKIVAVSGPGAVALTIDNRSSLERRDNEVIQNGLRNTLEGLGIRFVKTDQAAATVVVSLSENTTSYVWVAEIRQSAGDTAVVMVSMPRAEGSSLTHDAVPLSLHKIPLWNQTVPILDVAVLEENATPTHIAVLDAESVSFYRMQGGKWQQEQALSIIHTRPWPRDLHGRLILAPNPAKDHLLDVYLPGVMCRSTATVPLSLNCRESDEPWPLVTSTLSGGVASFTTAGVANGRSLAIPQMRAFFASTRNFFTGALTPAVGKFTSVPKFYSAALLPREKYTLWLFAATDGQVHMIDGVSDQAAKFGWGSDVASVKTSCGAGWQVLATSFSDQIQAGDSVRAFEFPDRDPVGVSAAIDFPGAITALWTEQKGDSAIAVARNRETGSYEAFRLLLACSQ